MPSFTKGVSNAKGKNELDWRLKYPTWRQGFIASYARLKAAP
jgi:hypothetical protein